MLPIGKDNMAVIVVSSKLRVVAHHQRTGGDLCCAQITIARLHLPIARIDHHVDASSSPTDIPIVATCKIHILTANNRSAAATDFKAIIV